MFVPHYRLPEAHRMLAHAGVLARAEIAQSYGEVLRRVMSRPENANSAVSAAA